jgi:hypothetical protein
MPRGHLGGPHACCLIRPGEGNYFPAAISTVRAELPLRLPIPAIVSAAPSDGEAQAIFAAGQRFTIWADAVVGHTIRADGPVGHGVISRPLPPLLDNMLDVTHSFADLHEVINHRSATPPYGTAWSSAWRGPPPSPPPACSSSGPGPAPTPTTTADQPDDRRNDDANADVPPAS